MSQSGHKRAKTIKLSQKRTCGNRDEFSKIYSGCVAEHETGSAEPIEIHICSLGFNFINEWDGDYPAEPCLKPVTNSQYVYAMKLQGMIK